MAKAYAGAKKRGEKLVICNEGGSRAGKTFDAFSLIIAICANNIDLGLDIYILRDTLKNSREKTYKDFKKLLKISGLLSVVNITSENQSPDVNLYGNNIYFRGLDDEKNTEGYPSDILFVNEVLETKKTKVEGLQMRCRLLEIYDWNPKLTKHWIFEYEGRPDVLFTRTTYKNNKHLEKTIIDKIESYNPEIEANIKNKTANLFRWKVYGIGERADQEGNVFNDSQLNKYSPEKVDLTTSIKIAWCDVADQGVDYLCFIVGAMVEDRIYIVDVVYTPCGSEKSIDYIINSLKKNNIHVAWFESNNQGLIYTKLLKKQIIINECQEKGITDIKNHKSALARKIKARPSISNKHSRIIMQAEVSIIPNFYFKELRGGMYAEYYDSLTNYKHDKSVKQDDAPDATAGLSMIAEKYM
jgi:PBSX family phage terminase large subunit